MASDTPVECKFCHDAATRNLEGVSPVCSDCSAACELCALKEEWRQSTAECCVDGCLNSPMCKGHTCQIDVRIGSTLVTRTMCVPCGTVLAYVPLSHCDSRVDYFDDDGMYHCHCGNAWDGNAQCTCCAVGYLCPSARKIVARRDGSVQP